MSAPDPGTTTSTTSGSPLLLVIDPVARRTDGESVRIARDVLCAGAPGVKVCLPDGPRETERVLARRGSRRLVVVGDDCALLRAVRLLYRERELADAALAVVPVGTASSVALTRGLGLPCDAVSAARTALAGVSRRLGLLIDDSGGVVLGGLRIPETLPGLPGLPDVPGAAAPPNSPGPHGTSGPPGGSGAPATSGMPGGPGGSSGAPGGPGDAEGADGAASGYGGRSEEPGGLVGPAQEYGGDGEAHGPWPRSLRERLRAVRESGAGGDRARHRHGERHGSSGAARRLRVEADGRLLADLDQPVSEVSVTSGEGEGGLAQVTVRSAVRTDGSAHGSAPEAHGDAAAARAPVRVRARAVTVSGPDFRYRADVLIGGPVRRRTWTAVAGAWTLTLPA